MHLSKYYFIDYITEKECRTNNRNVLYGATKSEVFRYYDNIYEIELGDQDRLIAFKERDLLKYSYPAIAPDEVKEKLNDITVEIIKISFIILIFKG